MKKTILVLLCSAVCVLGRLPAQAPSVQLKIKEKSGFLGMGGSRIVLLGLANQNRQKPVTSDNVNAGPYYYFLCTPVGDYQLDADFVKEDLANVQIYQNEQKYGITWKSDIIADSVTSILLGFPKDIKLNQLFLFQCQDGDAINQVEFKVPEEYWPGYTLLMDMLKQGDAAAAAKDYRTAAALYGQIASRPELQIFTQFNEARERRTRCYSAFLGNVLGQYQTVMGNQQIDLKDKIAQIDSIRPLVTYVIDSLPRPAWNIPPTDPSVATILDRSRTSLSQFTLVRDSLQRALDDRNVSWIIEGSVTGTNGYLYQYMVEALTYAFSSLNFQDTAATDLQVRIPEDQRARLVKYNLTESYDTFLRICNERYQTHLPIFPIDFLPNLRKDTAAFTLPVYPMLKAVNDYYYGNLAAAREEVFRVFRTCTEPELTAKYDFLRIMIGIREHQVSADVMRMLTDAEQSEQQRDANAAQEKYRQLTLVAPDFAYGFFALGRFYSRTGDQIRALFSFQRAYQIDTLYLTAYREAYNLYLKQGNYKPVIEVLTTALQKGNDYWEVDYNLGIAYLGDGDAARAIQSFERALALNGRSYKTNIQLGLAHQSVKNFQKAREYFNSAIGLDPTRQEAVDYLTKLNELQRNAR